MPRDRDSTTLIHRIQSFLSNVISPMRFTAPMSKLNWSAHVRRGRPIFLLPRTNMCSTLMTGASYICVERIHTNINSPPLFFLEIDSTPKRRRIVTLGIWSIIVLAHSNATYAFLLSLANAPQPFSMASTQNHMVMTVWLLLDRTYKAHFYHTTH